MLWDPHDSPIGQGYQHGRKSLLSIDLEGIAMSRSVAAIQKGLNYQARFFWTYAAVRLLNPEAPVSRVGFEVDDVGGFDDVVVEWSKPDRDQFGRSVRRDCYQVKFHVDQAGALTADGLTDPREIGGTSRSLLQRLQAAHASLGDEAPGTRLFLVTTYPIDQNDLLARLVSSTEGGFRMREFLEGGPGSKMGKLRHAWREHLQLEDDDELEDLLRPLRIWHSALNYQRLQDELELKLPAVGLRVISGDGAQSPYEQLIWRLNEEETYYFHPDALRHECERAGLAIDRPLAKPQRPKSRPPRGKSAAHRGWSGPRRCAVRSFKRPGVDLADTADDLLSLLEFFDGRFLHAECSWNAVYEQLEPFLTSVLSKDNAFDLLLDTHTSLAFAIGTLLHAKLGLDLNVLQRLPSGVEPWSTRAATSPVEPGVAVEEVGLGLGSDVAIALGITHDVVSEVRQHIVDVGIPARRILAVRLTAGSGQAAVRGGEHALSIAEEVARLIKQRARGSQLHIFAAAPNTLVFFLGQLCVNNGVTLYEYDFERIRSSGYEVSLSLPAPCDP